MVETTDRRRVKERPRSSTATEYEVFVRESGESPMRHVGSVTAGSPEGAHEHASKLFGWFATDVWVCPADAMTRFAGETIDDEAVPADPGGGTERRQRKL